MDALALAAGNAATFRPVRRRGRVRGAVPEDEVVGVYWVTTMPRFRSRGMGRALMHALLRRFGDRPVTLTASRLGRPLYESLGFEPLGDAHWWS
ncbi:GNAT family N-acetyltransferase [Dactylosporangium sp. CA-139066]|uniref:GNAT family N-acetyltransferase n=1 Tax=Dactylosporangium sp. CA-139066 TaxID=3239930 RepID=UPI003D935F2B